MKIIQKNHTIIILFFTLCAVCTYEYTNLQPPFYPEYFKVREFMMVQLALPVTLLKILDSTFQQFLPNPSETLFIGYLILGLVICTFVYFIERKTKNTTSSSLSSTGEPRTPPSNFLSFLFPNGFLRNSNVRIDMFLFATKVFWKGFSLTIPLLSLISVQMFTISFLKNHFISPNIEAGTILCVFFSILLLLVTDLAFYATHYFQHFTRFGWSLHETHHSQTELNIFTDDRDPPLNFILISLFPAGIFGFVLGFFLFLSPSAKDVIFANFTIGYLLWMPTKIFRHSHILIRYPAWLEWLFQSPAYHIVHHSTLPQHQNKNLGNVTTVWDRLFGTLYVPLPGEVYKFGTGVEEVENAHKSLYGIYIWQSIRIGRQFLNSCYGIFLCTFSTPEKNFLSN